MAIGIYVADIAMISGSGNMHKTRVSALLPINRSVTVIKLFRLLWGCLMITCHKSNPIPKKWLIPQQTGTHHLLLLVWFSRM
jgi:hypothetical protein